MAMPQPAPLQAEEAGAVGPAPCSEGSAGQILRISAVNFMCHDHLSMEFGPHITFISGANGSGKSAALTALQCCLGVQAKGTGRCAHAPRALACIAAATRRVPWDSSLGLMPGTYAQNPQPPLPLPLPANPSFLSPSPPPLQK